MRFLDTNILLYAVSRDPAEGEKAGRALRLLDERDLGLSVQVLQEFYVQATRGTKPDRLDHAAAADLVEAWLRYPVQEMSVAIMRAALKLKARYGLSYWDAAIIEAARTLGCREIFSEDLSAEQSYDGVRVINPFT